MGNKIKRDIAAFSKRVRMAGSGIELYAIVEGKGIDRTFYDRIFTSLGLEGYEIRLASDFKLDGKSAGGKSFALQLFDFLQDNSSLKQANSSGAKRIGFILDRDYDHLAGLARESAHIIYTRSADVESEVLINGNIIRAIASAYSLDEKTAARALANVGNPMDWIAEMWKEWITLLVLCTRHKIPSAVQVGSLPSLGNAPKRPELRKSSEVKDAIRAKLPVHEYERLVEECNAELEAIYTAGESRLLVKGKWAETLVHTLVYRELDDVSISSNVQKDVLTKCCTESLSFAGPWIDHYRSRITRLSTT